MCGNTASLCFFALPPSCHCSPPPPCLFPHSRVCVVIFFQPVKNCFCTGAESNPGTDLKFVEDAAAEEPGELCGSVTPQSSQGGEACSVTKP